MTKTTFQITHPDGTTATRTSQSRTYTHALVLHPADPTRYADYLDRQATALEVYAAALRAAVTARKITKTPRRLYGDSPTYSRFEYHLIGAPYDLRSKHFMVERGDNEGRTATLTDYAERWGLPSEPVTDGYLATGAWVLTDVVQHLLHEAQDRADEAETEAAGYRTRAVKVRETGVVDDEQITGYRVVRWSSRADLAAKAAASDFAYAVEQGCDWSVAPTVQVEKAAKGATAGVAYR